MNLLSPWHILLIGIVALLLFGNRLPEVARSMGRAINEFKKGLREVQDDVNDGDNPPAQTSQKLKPPRDIHKIDDESESEDRDRRNPPEALKPVEPFKEYR